MLSFGDRKHPIYSYTKDESLVRYIYFILYLCLFQENKCLY